MKKTAKMTAVTLVTPKIPDRFWKLMDMAYKDAMKVKRMKTVMLDMGVFFSPSGPYTKCKVCLAGSILLKEFKLERDAPFHWDMVDGRWIAALTKIDLIAHASDVGSKFHNLPESVCRVVNKHAFKGSRCSLYNSGYELFRQEPDIYFKRIRSIIRDLKKHDL